MYHVPLAVLCIYGSSDKEVKMGMVRRGVNFLEGGREWRLPGLLYAYDLVLCGGSEEELRVMVGWFAEVCRRRGLKINAGDGTELRGGIRV